MNLVFDDIADVKDHLLEFVGKVIEIFAGCLKLSFIYAATCTW